LHGPVAAAVALAAVVLAVCAVAVLRPVLLGDSDPRSPFVRFMLLVCVLIGRPPGDYLPPEPPTLTFWQAEDDQADAGQADVNNGGCQNGPPSV
jgi:hypothetical protein